MIKNRYYCNDVFKKKYIYYIKKTRTRIARTKKYWPLVCAPHTRRFWPTAMRQIIIQTINKRVGKVNI